MKAISEEMRFIKIDIGRVCELFAIGMGNVVFLKDRMGGLIPARNVEDTLERHLRFREYFEQIRR